MNKEFNSNVISNYIFKIEVSDRFRQGRHQLHRTTSCALTTEYIYIYTYTYYKYISGHDLEDFFKFIK